MIQRENQLSSTLTPLSKKLYEEVLTSHNISILLLIRAYIAERGYEVGSYPMVRRRGFCRLIQFLLQSPDFSFSHFLAVISEDKYCLGQVILNRFQTNVLDVVNSDVDVLLNSIAETGRYLIEPIIGSVYNSTSIHRSCPVGLFFRKMLVFLDKLTFSQTVKVYRLYQQYYLMGKSSIKNESLIVLEPNLASDISNDVNMESMNMEKSDLCDTCSSKQNERSCCMEVSVVAQNPFTNPIVALFGVNPIPDTDEKYVECLSWSRRQTELFLAEQAIFLQFDENSALPPPELHRILKRIITINPDYSEAYFVSYLNCLRIKEFNGALENLIQFFDSVNFTDKTKSYRFAALNLAIFNVKFDNRVGAINALKECITLSHESNDNLCLHIAQAWLRCLNENVKLDVIESTVLKCEKSEIYQIASLSLQMCAQKLLHVGLNGNIILSLLDKSDAVNAQNRIPDLTLTSIAYRSSIWCSYGQLNISFLVSQVLLNIDTSFAVYGITVYNTEEVCTSICNVANFLTNVGKYNLANAVLSHARSRFPYQFSNWWKMCEQNLIFEHTLHCNLWNEAFEAGRRIANIDKKESMLRLAELFLEKGDKLKAATQIDELIHFVDKNEERNVNKPYYLLRAYIIGARARSGGAAFYMLKKALEYSIRYGYPRFRALIQLELAKIQLELGFVKQATQLVQKSSVLIFSENKYCEQAAALILLAKCNVASVRHLEETDVRKISSVKSAISKLENAKKLYLQLECLSKVKDIVYFQAILANDIDLQDARNAYALEFRKIDSEHSESCCCTLEFCSSL